jgi:hypothetical protein
MIFNHTFKASSPFCAKTLQMQHPIIKTDSYDEQLTLTMNVVE